MFCGGKMGELVLVVAGEGAAPNTSPPMGPGHPPWQGTGQEQGPHSSTLALAVLASERGPDMGQTVPKAQRPPLIPPPEQAALTSVPHLLTMAK